MFMKSRLVYGIFIGLIFLVSIVNGLGQPIENSQKSATLNQNMLFVEYATTTWCPQCPDASNALYELYLSEQYPFYYITLVSDVNTNANQRSRDFDTVAIPTIYLNGGKSIFVGNAESYDALKNIYIDLIIEQSMEQKQHDISIETDAQWLGNAQIAINVTVTNNANRAYFGRLRTYVSEITSRWLDEQGNPYHYAMLDFAFNEKVFLPKQSSKTFTTIWDGMIDHNGLTFGDIIKENIVVTSAMYHWIPHPKLGYVSFPYIQFFFSHYTDAVDMTEC